MKSVRTKENSSDFESCVGIEPSSRVSVARLIYNAASASEDVFGNIIASRAIAANGGKAFVGPPTVSVYKSILAKDLDSNRSQPPISSVSEQTVPTEEERMRLRRIPGKIPWISFSLCLVEFAERASYYGAKTVFSNFIQRPLPIGTRVHNVLSMLTQ